MLCLAAMTAEGGAGLLKLVLAALLVQDCMSARLQPESTYSVRLSCTWVPTLNWQ